MPNPLSVRELNLALKSLGVDVNKTTLYRQLETLKSLNKIREIDFGEGKARFELERNECHHHMVCESCGKVEDIEIDEKKLLSGLKSKSTFKVNRHSIEFFGLCADCK